MSNSFANALLHWYDKKGRHDLPWRQQITPYRVWLSEIMLQQTQVVTVIPYFERFIKTFPSIDVLANVSLDAVLTLWAGLGYYTRARCLHKTAQIVTQQYNGVFPPDLEKLQALPGIGRSTAGAILAIAYQQKAAILEGNVKRILTRLHCMKGAPSLPKVQKKLWQLAEHYTPNARVADYTQAIMDLGAMVCTRQQPHCVNCPLQNYCQAYQKNKTQDFPEKTKRKVLPVKQAFLLLTYHAKQQKILLEKRPNKGIWGGLWSLPEFSTLPLLNAHCQQHLQKFELQIQEKFRHTFTHFHLDITPVLVETGLKPVSTNQRWHPVQELATIGLPAPIKKILNERNILSKTTKNGAKLREPSLSG